MIRGLTELEKFKVIRPIIGECQYDAFDMPIVKKCDFSHLNLNQIEVVNCNGIKASVDNKNKIVLMFAYDKVLMRFWNEPLKRVPAMQTYAAIATPDFSIYPTMNINEIRHNIFKSRWLGRIWQNYGVTVIPTVGWATPESYDLCFSGIEKNGAVIISTLGCNEYKDVFLAGFNEMKKRLEPSLIIVYGNMMDGMSGTFLNFKYTDIFNVKNKQLRIKEIPSIFTIKEVI